jgi:hypothetical protein
MATTIDTLLAKGELETSACVLIETPREQTDADITRVQSIYRGRLARKSVSLEQRMSDLPLTVSSISPTKSRRLSVQCSPSHTPDTSAEVSVSGDTPLMVTVGDRDSIEAVVEGVEALEIEDLEMADTGNVNAGVLISADAALELEREEEAKRDAVKRQKIKDDIWGTEAEPEQEEEIERPMPTTEQEVREEMNYTRKVLANTDTAWGLRCKALHRIEEMVRFLPLPFPASQSTDLQSWPAEMLSLVPQLQVQVNELRSSIVRETCRLLIALANCFPDQLEPLVIRMMPNLLANYYIKIRVVQESSKTCFQELVVRIPSVTFVRPLLDAFQAETHGPARAGCIEGLATVTKVTCENAAWDAEDGALRSRVLEILVEALNDKDKECRDAGKALFHNYQAKWPASAEECHAALEPSIQKRLEEKGKGKGKAGSRLPSSKPNRPNLRAMMMAKKKEAGGEAGEVAVDIVV